MSDQFIFGNEELQDNEERVSGGGFTADESNASLVIFENVYLTQSQHGAWAANLQSKNKNGDERSYQIYFTNRKGEVFYKDKKSGNNVKLPGYQLLDSIALATCGKSFQEVLKAAKNKVIDLYDYESRKDVPTEVKTLPLICKKALIIGVIKKVDNKFKNGKKTSEKRESNEIHMAFRKEDKLTAKEYASGATEPKMYNQWVAYWQEPARFKDEYEVVEDEDSSMGDSPFGLTSDDVDLFNSDETDSSSEDTTTSEPNLADKQEEEEDPFL